MIWWYLLCVEFDLSIKVITEIVHISDKNSDASLLVPSKFQQFNIITIKITNRKVLSHKPMASKMG